MAMFTAWFLVVFNVLFPKGGFKVGFVPITWGYVFLGLTAPVLLVYRLLALPLRYRRNLYLAMLCMLPMQCIFIYTGLTFGLADTGFAVGNAVNFIFLPWVVLGIYAPFLPLIDGNRLSRYFRWSIFLTVIWGIFLFVWHPLTGHFVEIPYFTVNAGDYGDLEYTKHIARGLFLKLISTYNNGNLYGVAMLIFLPLYELLEAKVWRRRLLKLALVLTLSRTVWVGIVLYEALPLITLLARQAKTLPVLYLGDAKNRVLALIAISTIIFSSLVLNGSGLGFLLDPTAGGRLGQLNAITEADWLPVRGLQGLSEATYSSATFMYGYFGLIAFLLMMWGPMLLLLVDRSPLKSPTRLAALKGIILYCLVATIDGGINYLPVMLFFWFAYLIYLYGWPGEAEGTLVIATPQKRRVKNSLWRRLLPRKPRVPKSNEEPQLNPAA
ncbi:hypothetical protein [Granulicella cerasi]|uniref:hypothetical protein n=1 Tax=Granulicella cerasi TaxID=741063 RepID=UPI0021DF8D43|nr:hypothetical protein [Granulicella cerasi]